MALVKLNGWDGTPVLFNTEQFVSAAIGETINQETKEKVTVTSILLKNKMQIGVKETPDELFDIIEEYID